MALPIVHLLTARRFAQDKPELAACPEYYLGAVAPDGIAVRDGNDKSRKGEIHLGNWNAFQPERVLAYWAERSAPFDIGWGVHVLTDAAWRPAKDIPQLLDEGGRLRVKIYYNDCGLADFSLLARLPEAAQALDLAGRAAAPQDHPLLTGSELAAWRDFLTEFYAKPMPWAPPARYIDEAYILAFIERVQDTIKEIYRRSKT